MKDLSPGDVVRLARRAADLSQAELGRRTGYSAASISRFETGARPLSDVGVLRVFATELAIPLALFGLAASNDTDVLAGALPPAESAAAVRVAGDLSREGGADAVRRRQVLAGLAGLTGAAALGRSSDGAAIAPAGLNPRLDALLLITGGAAAPVATCELARRLARAKAAFERCRYRELGHLLPELVATATATHHSAAGQDSDRTAVTLSGAYQLASELSVKLNDDGMALVAADRAHAAAQASGDAATIAAAARSIAIALRRLGHHDAATALLTRTALSLDVDTEPAPPLLAAYGSLLCTAAYASAQRGNRAEALDLVCEAEQAAVRLGDCRPGTSVFGSTNVAVYRIGIHTTLGEAGVALSHARGVNQRLLPTAERHARFWIDTARAWEAFGRVDHAYGSLRAAERHAAEELHRPSVQAFVAGLLYGAGPTPAGLRALATRTGAVDNGH